MQKTFLTSAALSAALLGSAVAGNADALDASLITKEKSFWDRFSFGSYGEIHANFFKDGGTEVDPHRIVLFANFEFNDKLKLVTETELEHALEKPRGEASFTTSGVQLKLELAYLDYTYSEDLSFRGGLFFAPVGIINEVHEPTTFYGVERPNVEVRILPTTWTVGGVGFTKKYGDDWQFDGVLHGGNDTEGGSIRGGRSSYGIDLFTVNSEQNRFNQNNDSWAVTGRAKYNGFDNLNLGASLQYQSDMDSAASGSQDGFLAEAHGIYRNGGFQFIALGSAWEIDVESEGDSQWGYYLEPSYAWDTPIGKVGVFGRFSQYEFANLREGSEATKFTEYNFGGNYWINENLVVKADYLIQERDSESGSTDTLNLGFGWYY